MFHINFHLLFSTVLFITQSIIRDLKQHNHALPLIAFQTIQTNSVLVNFPWVFTV